MSRIITRELAQEEAEALVAAKQKAQLEVALISPPATVVVAAEKVLPATPQPDLAQPVVTGPGGDTRDSGQPSVHETLTSVAKAMKESGH